MNKRDILEVGLKLYGIGTFLNFIQSLIRLVFLISIPPANDLSLFGSSSQEIPVAATQTLLYLLISFILLAKTNYLAKKIMSVGSPAEKLEKSTVFELVITYIGLVQIVSAVISLIAMLITVVWINMQTIYSIQAIMAVIVLILGIVLIKYASRISVFLMQKIPSWFWPK